MATGSMSKGPGKSYREGLSLDRLFRMFPTDEAAEAWFTAERWPDGPYCPHCGSRNIQCGIAHPTMPEAAHVLAQDRDGDAGLAARLSNMARREARTRMETIKDKPAVRLKPSSYQPSKAEMEEDIGIDTTPEDLLRAVVCDVRIEYDENA